MTISERLDRGLIKDVAGLSRQEQGELLIWAREKPIKWKDILRKFKFKVKESTLRGRYRKLMKGGIPRKPEFTERDVSYLLVFGLPSFPYPITLHKHPLLDAKIAN